MLTTIQMQEAIERKYHARDYSRDPMIIALGLCEEVGEVAAAVLNSNPAYKRKSNRERHTLLHELGDCLAYLCALANVTGIDLKEAFLEVNEEFI